jgi:thioredoxin reductase
MMKIEDVVIIGAGPAGIATALQLKRYGILQVVFERDGVGGLLRNANLVENYPGFPDGISGVSLVELFTEQMEKQGVYVRFEEVRGLDYVEDMFIVETSRETIGARIAVIASGTQPKKLNDPTIPDKVRERVFYEVYEIRNIAGKRVAIVGAGDSAFDYAITLSEKNEVLIFNRSGEHKCNEVLWERVSGLESVTYMSEVVLENIKGRSVIQFVKDVVGIGDEERLRLRYERREDGGSITEKFDYLLIAIGREPRLDFLAEGLRDRMNELIEEKRLFMVGDVKNDIYRQTTIAVGDGVRAGMEIGEILRGNI